MLTISLIDPKIPPNTGTIARLAAATNSKLDIVGNIGFSLDDSHLKRAGLDYWEHVNWDYHEKTQDYLDKIKAKYTEARHAQNNPNQETSNPGNIYLFTTKTDRLYTDVKYTENDTLIFGSETQGLSDEIKSQFPDSLLKIPLLNPHIRSLNLANAVSIVLYEALRQTL